MKKILYVLLFVSLSVSLSVSLFSCGKKVNETQKPNTDTSSFEAQSSSAASDTKKSALDTQSTAPISGDSAKIVDIVDIAKRDNIPCAQALEWFYFDAEYKYYYSCIKSKYVIVRYSDGSEETAENALKNGTISLSDLDRFDIEYHKEKR